MANENGRYTPIVFVREEDLDELTALQREIQTRMDRAHSDGRRYMMSQYVRILAGINKEVKRIRNRFDREMLATARKEEQLLKEEQRKAAAQAEEEEQRKATAQAEA